VYSKASWRKVSSASRCPARRAESRSASDSQFFNRSIISGYAGQSRSAASFRLESRFTSASRMISSNCFLLSIARSSAIRACLVASFSALTAFTKRMVIATIATAATARPTLKSGWRRAHLLVLVTAPAGFARIGSLLRKLRKSEAKSAMLW